MRQIKTLIDYLRSIQSDENDLHLIIKVHKNYKTPGSPDSNFKIINKLNYYGIQRFRSLVYHRSTIALRW